jgi:pyridoxal 5'-phosphate synthase pdxS subunit
MKRANAIVRATTNYQDAKVVGEVSRGLGEAIVGRGMESLEDGERMAARGW